MDQSPKKDTITRSMMRVLVPLTFFLVLGVNLILFFLIRNNNKAALSKAMEEIVTDNAKFRGGSTNGPTISGAIDAGYVSQNIDLACEALGLCTVPRATMDKETLKKELKLTDSQNPILNHPIGYKK